MSKTSNKFLEQMAANTVKGNSTGSTANPTDLPTTGSGNVVFSSAPTLANPVVGTQTTSDNSTKAASTAFVATAVSNAIAGVNPAVAVQAATTAASDTSGLTYNNGVSGIGATLTGSVNTPLTFDGFTITGVNQRVLVKNDTQSPSGALNGVYFLSQLQTGILPPILTRALDYDQSSDINNTGAIPVVNGTVNASTSWLLTSNVNTVGTDPLTYTKFSSNPTTLLSNTLTNAHIFVGNGSNVATDVAVTGDITISNAGVTAYAGTVPVNKGGTGDTSLTAHGVLLGNGSGAVSVTSAGTAGQVLTSNGPSADPTYQPAGTASPLTTKGDLYGFSTVNARLPAGTDGQHLSADSTQTLGIKWITSGRTINPQTGTTYTFVLADGSATDGNPLVSASNAAAQTYTVPTNASVAFPIGTQIDVTQLGAGLVTIAAAGGVTINSSSGGLTMSGQYSAISLVKTGTDTWELYGNSVATTGAPRSEVQVSGFSGQGSTNTKVVRFSTIEKNTGTDITYAASSTLADSFTINTAGIYNLSYSAEAAANPVQMAITVNGTALSTDPATPLTYAQGARKLGWANTAGFGADISWSGILAVNDVVRFHSNTVTLRNDFRTTASVVKSNN